MSPTQLSHIARTLRGLAGLSLLALFPAMGCVVDNGGDPSAVDSLTDPLNGPAFGVDYAWARPSLSSLKSQGYKFVVRYMSYDTTGKDLSPGEAKAIKAAGLDIVANWEWGANDVLQGYDRGVQHAHAAESQAHADGMPKGRPIYFSIDFDAQPSDQGAINAYFDGVASVIGRKRTGAYGGHGVIKRLFDDGKITWGWQTYAWSYGKWESRAHLRQIQNGIGPGGGEDKDQAMTADFGQWGASSAPPTAKPTAPKGCGTIHQGQGLTPGEKFSSCDGHHTLAMQTDGNLVLYHNGKGATWASNTYKSDGDVAIMQTDGNFVLYGHHSNALWASGTNGHGGARLVVQDDGNLVVYGPGNKALWASGTNGK